VGLRGPLIVLLAGTASCAGLFGIEDLTFEGPAPSADATVSPAGPARFCDGYTAVPFCEDFDAPDASAPRFELSGPESSAALTDNFFSPPRALAFTVAVDQPGFVRLARTATTERPVRLSFALFLRDFEAPPAGNTSVLATLERVGSTIAIRRVCVSGISAVCRWVVTVDVPDVGGTVQSSTFPLVEKLASEDGWARIAMETFFDRDGYVNVTVGTERLVAEPVATMRVPALPTDRITGSVGVTITQGRAAATDVLVDDVLLEITEGSRP
jgi:hypothetical protein